MNTAIDALGTFGLFFLTILGIFAIISCIMWFFVPFWILSMKTSLEKIVHLLENQNLKK